jgi:hypothetical protein
MHGLLALLVCKARFTANFGPLLGSALEPIPTTPTCALVLLATMVIVVTDGNLTARPDGTTCDNPSGDWQCLNGTNPETIPGVYQAIKGSANSDYRQQGHRSGRWQWRERRFFGSRMSPCQIRGSMEFVSS